MEQFVNRSSFRKHLDVFITKINIALKENKEYKSNLWAILLTDVVVFIVYLIFYSVIGSILIDSLNWSLHDFMIFFLFALVTCKTPYWFSLRKFSDTLLSGNINVNILRPVNTFFMENIRIMRGGSLVSWILIFFVLIISLFFSGYSFDFLKIILLIFLFGFAVVYFLIFIDFLESLGFILKKSENFFNFLNNNVNYLNEKYTPKVFEGSSFYTFFHILPSALYGYFIIEFLKGNVELVLNFLPYIFYLFCILLIGLSCFGIMV